MNGTPVHFRVVTRSKSRQDSHSGNTSSHSSLEGLAQRVELSSLVEESPDVSIEELKVNENDERFVQSGSDRHQVSTMAEARGLTIIPGRFRGGIEENVEEYLTQFDRVAKANGWDENKNKVILPCYLEAAALKWYENMEGTMGDGLTWAQIRDGLKETFQGIAWEEQVEYRLRMRMQGEMEPVEAYVQDLMEQRENQQRSRANEKTGNVAGGREQPTGTALRRWPLDGWNQGRGRGGYRQHGRGRTADGRVICYQCNRPGHYAVACRSGNQGNEKGNR
ncbi:hypothetical protein J6590_080756 [Homalodisca vitripennis]|nr:hypothetical protein J6590_080756 [Homalodisca vitripennis]